MDPEMEQCEYCGTPIKLINGNWWQLLGKDVAINGVAGKSVAYISHSAAWCKQVRNSGVSADSWAITDA